MKGRFSIKDCYADDCRFFFLVFAHELSVCPEKSILRELILQIVRMIIAKILKGEG